MDDGAKPVRINLNPIATPLPLAFAGLLIASALDSGSELGWVPMSQHHSLGWMLVAIPVPLQLLAAWWGFVARSATAATGSAVLAAVWIATGLDMIHSPPSRIPSHALGLLMLAAAAALLVPALAEVRSGSLLPTAVLGIAALRFVLAGVAGTAHSTTWAHVSGWTGVAVAVVAAYGALALELEGTTQEALLPVLRARMSQQLMEKPLAAQVSDVEHESGVRKIL